MLSSNLEWHYEHCNALKHFKFSLAQVLLLSKPLISKLVILISWTILLEALALLIFIRLFIMKKSKLDIIQ